MPNCMSYEKNGERQTLNEIDDLIAVQVFGEQPDPKQYHWAFNLCNFVVSCGKKLDWIASSDPEKYGTEVIAVAKWLLDNGYKEDAWAEIGRS